MPKLLGHRSCPVCGDAGAQVLETSKQRPMLYCESCVCQIFARGKRSGDRLLAGLVTSAAPAAPPVAATAAPNPPAAAPAPGKKRSFLDDM
jgi:hypothetical protein